MSRGDDIVVQQKGLSQEYLHMVERINRNYPAIKKDSENFYKAHSQFMQWTLDVACLTPIRSARQMLAEINKTKLAIEEAGFAVRKKRLEIAAKEEQRSTATGTNQALLDVEIDELGSQIANIDDNVKGAIRKISALMTQYRNILEKTGKKRLTERDFEDDEERYHILTAFNQALCAARARGGLIDEGNHIYLFQLGINGTDAQMEVTNYLESEQRYFMEGGKPEHETTLRWLDALAEKYKGCVRGYLDRRGMLLLDVSSLCRQGDA